MAAVANVRRRIVDGLRAWELVCCLVLLLADDRLYDRAGYSFVPAGPLDEIAHILTALLILELLPRKVRDFAPFWVLLGSFAIDVDHVPGYLGYQFLTAGTPRPYTHSLMTIVVLLVAGLSWRRGRRALWALALGVTLHFLRDLAEGNGSGVPLLWPFTDHAFSYSHTAYVALMLGVTSAGVVIALRRGRAGDRVAGLVAGSGR
jgi:inner membrane protein